MQKLNLPYRKSIRLKGWDYRNSGLYFITICTKDREPHFGEIRDGVMGLSVPGCVAHYYWTQIIDQFPSVELDEYIVMPNHIHGIVGITGDHNTQSVGSSIHGDRETGGVTQHHNPMLYQTHVGKIIRWYKGRCTFEIRKRGYSDFACQSRFYDHIIRNERSLDRIREYIFNNPLRWQMDREHPDRVHERGVEFMEHAQIP